MKKTKRLLTFGGLGLMAMLLTACTNKNTYKIPPHGFPFGTIYKYIGVPIQHLLEWISTQIGGNGYGFAILLITLFVRIVLMPSMLKQQRGSAMQQEKAKVLKPQLDLLQKAAKVSSGQQETMRINGLMQDVYKKNGSSMMPSTSGCLVLLLQLPIFSGLYYAVAYSPEISKSTFFGFQLGDPSFWLTIIASALYAVQSLMMLYTAPAEQRKTMSTMVIFSPMMTFFISVSAPAGLTLYFFGTGLIMVIQQAILSFIITPGIRKRLDEEFTKKPVVEVVKPDMFDADGRINDRAPMPDSLAAMGMAAGAQPDGNQSSASSTETTVGDAEEDLRARNAGKQKRE
ncbi:membrane protein insertase YidC [Lacticaseibacillus hulanensis]|uniref:membrane protein insertase YidC n=1 Tax=Lacticaseibacillus hulanensis TaxID=2493111 RepID=UPI000FD71678|nr:membrane protein insertase YidC [Lacticaseibacillus hulanensis]